MESSYWIFAAMKASPSPFFYSNNCSRVTGPDERFSTLPDISRTSEQGKIAVIPNFQSPNSIPNFVVAENPLFSFLIETETEQKIFEAPIFP